MSVDVIVIGAGGFGRETLDVIEAHNAAIESRSGNGPELRVIGVADDRPSQKNLERLEARQYNYLGTTDEVIAKLGPRRFIIAVGSPTIKNRLDYTFSRAGWEPITVVHPRATVGSQCDLAEGTIICSGAQISTNSRLGRHVHVNPNATIGHDAVLEDYVSVNPAAVVSGEVTVGRGSLIGASSVILQGLRVGSAATIGASACVVRNVDPSATMVGIPARTLTLDKMEERSGGSKG